MSTQLIKANYLVILPPTQHHSFFRNIPPLFIIGFAQFTDTTLIRTFAGAKKVS